MKTRTRLAFLVSVSAAAFAQSSTVGPFSSGAFSASGLLDAYYSYNHNHPTSRLNAFRNFDVRDRFNLNLARFSFDVAPGPVGLHMDFGAGRTAQTLHASEPKDVGRWSEFIPQMYVTLKPKDWGGFQVDFGKFYTSAGAEPTEGWANWNYSRSLVFTNGPYFHFGARVQKPITKEFTAGFQILNGWNNIYDNNDSKTVGFTTSYTKGKVAWANAYYVGKEQPRGGPAGYRNFFDTAVTVTWNSKVASYVNIDLAGEQIPNGRAAKWAAVATATRVQLSPKWAIAPRIEWFNDPKGFITGTAQAMKEFTFTAEYKVAAPLVARAEYRYDWSDAAIYDRKAPLGPGKGQPTFLLGIIAYVGKVESKTP